MPQYLNCIDLDICKKLCQEARDLAPTEFLHLDIPDTPEVMRALGVQVDDKDEVQIHINMARLYNARILADEGYVTMCEDGTISRITRLTAAGHRYLELRSNNALWRTVLAKLASAGAANLLKMLKNDDLYKHLADKL